MLFFLFVSGAWGGIDCPAESLAIEHTSPVTGIKKLTCGYLQDGRLIKHGPETEFNADKSVKKVIYYDQNVEGKKPNHGSINLPGAEDSSVTDESFVVLESLLKVLSLKQSSLNEGEFKVSKCDPKSSSWVKAALTKSDVQKSYSFNERCDASGSFTASFAKEFQVSFSLRNLRDFTSTSMRVVMSLRPDKSGLRYRFEVPEGSVSSKTKMISFKAQYEVSLDPMTGTPLPVTQDGKITLQKVGDKVIDITRVLNLAH